MGQFKKELTTQYLAGQNKVFGNDAVHGQATLLSQLQAGNPTVIFLHEKTGHDKLLLFKHCAMLGIVKNATFGLSEAVVSILGGATRV